MRRADRVCMWPAQALRCWVLWVASRVGLWDHRALAFAPFFQSTAAVTWSFQFIYFYPGFQLATSCSWPHKTGSEGEVGGIPLLGVPLSWLVWFSSVCVKGMFCRIISMVRKLRKHSIAKARENKSFSLGVKIFMAFTSHKHLIKASSQSLQPQGSGF